MKKLQYNAPVILSFFFLSLLALLLGYLTKGWTTTALFSVYRASLASPLTYVRFLGHVLGHADFNHFLGNMLLLARRWRKSTEAAPCWPASCLPPWSPAFCNSFSSPIPPSWAPAVSYSCSLCWPPSPACGVERSPSPCSW